MVFLDETVVNVALPSIKTDLGFTQATLGWVVSAYIVVFGGLVLAGGRAADLFGRRRMFLAGTAVFGAASLADGLAASRLVGRTGPRPLAIAGLATAAVAMTLLGHATPAAGYWAGLLPAVIVLGLGAGLSFVSITTAALERVDDAAAGLASGLLSTTVQIGGAVGVTVLAGVAATWRSSGLLAGGAAPLAAQAGGLRLGFLLAAAVSLTAALVAVFALQRGTAGAPAAPAVSEAAA
jgi:MFS family permease